ncbi:GFA family protein [Nioella nitratireducens]|uniref:GFA family protein n=1 Tax=Nioella nitratireducens TaxID=1287720 RepID=UPI0008FD36B4|nr:GFA family protein [Nioella nitratireducens]
MSKQSGGCICGALRYETDGDPLWVTACCCHFCQRATGSQMMIEPIFDTGAFRVTRGTPKVYTHVSGGSGKEVHVHFCAECGTKTNLTFQRWPDKLGIYGGTYDDPNWFALTPATTKFIFLDSAQRGTLVPPGYNTFHEHAATDDGAPLDPVVLSDVRHITR